MRGSRALLASSFQALLAEFWARVDRIVDLPAADCFCDDGEMMLGFVETRGRSAIEAYFRERADRERVQGRVTRHVLSNVWVEHVDDGSSYVRSIVSVYAGIGDLPLPAGSPSVIADFEYRLVGSPDDPRISVLCARSTFVGPGSLAAASTATHSS